MALYKRDYYYYYYHRHHLFTPVSVHVGVDVYVARRSATEIETQVSWGAKLNDRFKPKYLKNISSTNLYKKDGYRQRNVRHVTAISLRHNLDTSWESRRYVVAFTRFAGGGIWLRQESLRHILASPGYAPGTIAFKCYVDGKRIQCWSNTSQHVPIYLQPFTSYSAILVGNCNFFLLPCI